MGGWLALVLTAFAPRLGLGLAARPRLWWWVRWLPGVRDGGWLAALLLLVLARCRMCTPTAPTEKEMRSGDFIHSADHKVTIKMDINGGIGPDFHTAGDSFQNPQCHE